MAEARRCFTKAKGKETGPQGQDKSGDQEAGPGVQPTLLSEELQSETDQPFQVSFYPKPISGVVFVSVNIILAGF